MSERGQLKGRQSEMEKLRKGITWADIYISEDEMEYFVKVKINIEIFRAVAEIALRSTKRGRPPRRRAEARATALPGRDVTPRCVRAPVTLTARFEGGIYNAAGIGRKSRDKSGIVSGGVFGNRSMEQLIKDVHGGGDTGVS
ncbi:hypothetical protein EVAR_102618_1 [Eumeta japonica]|uniref:Uncharacterized protein n=1 Tax=Eumeta variegata TaxID=151549 RepID=A0A4C1TUS3_EUMVA|nr:hypothetical protein EVAR_102618_1 [Eumeta japonica]